MDYTKLILDKTIAEIEKAELEKLGNFTNDFNFGIKFAKEEIIKLIKKQYEQ